jgi:hypothetical protein
VPRWWWVSHQARAYEVTVLTWTRSRARAWLRTHPLSQVVLTVSNTDLSFVTLGHEVSTTRDSGWVRSLYEEQLCT